LEAIVMSKRDILLVKQGLCRLYHSWPHFIIKPVWCQQKHSSGAGEENCAAAAAAAAAMVTSWIAGCIAWQFLA
jgi:hypothetical protein